MPIIGSSASPKGVPGAPTIGTATAGDGTASVTFTAPGFSKLPVTSYTVTASPGGATGTGASSPITVSGLSNGTAYTFTVRATHTGGQSDASSASNSATPLAPYVLSSTFNASGNYTVPAGKTQVAILVLGSGSNGAAGSGRSGGAGGYGGRLVLAQDVATNAGTNYVVTIGGVGGNTVFGSLVTVGAASTNATGTINVANVSTNTTAGGAGGQGGSVSTAGDIGGAASSGTGLTIASTTYNSGGGGGGGAGGPQYGGNNTVGLGGQAGGAGGTGGGQGGGSGSLFYDSADPNASQATTGQGGGSASSRGGGGGGGGGGSFLSSPGIFLQAGPGNGGAGLGGQVLVFVK